MLKIIISLFLISFLGFSQTPHLLPGFPVIVDSSLSSGGSSENPIIADFNRDGQKEILVVCCLPYHPLFQTRVYLVKSNGEVMQNWPKRIQFGTVASAAGDINKDGFIDIVLVTNDSVYVLDYNGNNLPGFPVYFFGYNKPTKYVSLYDLDGDNWLEIIVIRKNRITVINHNGSTRTGWPIEIGSPNLGGFSHLSIGDLNKDGVAEIIAPFAGCPVYPCPDNRIFAFRPDGSNFPNWPIVTDSLYDHFPGPASIFERNDSVFIVINSSREVDTVWSIYYSRTSLYNYRGELVHRFYITNSVFWCNAIALADLNNDGSLDYVFGNTINDYVYNQNGVIFPGWPNLGGGSIIIGRLSNNFNVLSCINSADTLGFGRIFIYNYDGSQVSYGPLKPYGVPWYTKTTFTDLNSDKQVDLVVLTTSSGNPVRTNVYVWTFPGITYVKINFPWPMFAHDRYRTSQYGFLPPDEPIGIQPINSIIPSSFRLHQNYPNPFNPFTNIRFDIPRESAVRLVIYDVLGRELEVLVNEDLRAGEYRVNWDATKYSSGIYFYRITSESYSETRKMIVVK